MESRKDARSLTLRTAKVRAPTAQSAVNCAVLNISVSGACILVPEGAVIPDMFALEVDDESKVRNCKVVWRNGSRIGLTFDGLE